MWIILRGPRQFWIFLVAATILVGAAASLYLYGIFFIVHDWALLSEARRDLANAEVAQRNLNGAEQKLAVLGPEVAVMRASFADPQDPLPFIETVELLGRRLGVKTELTLASPASVGQADTYLVVVSGPFPKVATFLKFLEAFPFLVTLGDAEITRTGAITEISAPSGDSVRLSVAVKILILR